MWLVLFCIAIALVFLPLEITVGTEKLDRTGLVKRLKGIRQEKGVGLFGILMAGESNTAAAEVINDKHYRNDIARYSSSDCWFIYFTQEPKDKHDQKTAHEQHAEGVHAVSEWLDLDISQFPCFVFFERPEYERFIYLPLKGLSKDDIMSEVQTLFQFVREQKGRRYQSTFDAVKSYKSAKEFSRQGRALLGALTQLGIKFSAELISQKIPDNP